LIDNDIEGIDFPLEPDELNNITLKECIGPELAAKLNLDSEEYIPRK